jgi:hypothetical protein
MEITMELQSQRNPVKEILIKVSLGFIASLALLAGYIVFTGEMISSETIGLFFFFIGGIFFIIGGTRDFFESIIISKLRGKQTESILESSKDYLFGFGKPGEDIITGLTLIVLALICWTITL